MRATLPCTSDWLPCLARGASQRENPLIVNDPDVMQEVGTEFARYEQALVANDVETLIGYFRDAPETVRYGFDDSQYGNAEIGTFRRLQQTATPPRSLHRTIITTFGADFAVVDTEFTREGSDAVGRQSQTWVRTEVGWRVVSAHVSWLGGRGPS